MARFIFTLTLPDATGASRMAGHFAAAFRRKGHDVTLVHGPLPADSDSILPEMQSLGVETVAEPGLACPASPFLAARLARLFDQRRPAGVIGVQQRDRAIALQAAHRIGVPGFISAQNKHVFWGRWPINRLKERYYAWALRRFARLVVCTSHVVQDEVINRFGLGRERTAYLPNAIDLKQVARVSSSERDRIRAEFGVSPDQLLLLNVGRINLQKGQDLLLGAFRQIIPADRNVKLVLVGGVSKDSQQAKMERFREELVAFTERHQLTKHVVFAGWRSDVPDLLAACDGYVHAARWEGYPLAPLEAMAASKPCIWTDCSGHPEGFEEGIHGWVARKEDSAALRAAMERLLALTPEERQRMGQACRQLAESRYDVDQVGSRFVELVEAHSLN